MKSPILTSLVLALGLASSAAARDLTAAERAALAAQPRSHLATLRAGASDPVAGVATAERQALRRAEASAVDLGTLRAGDDHDLQVVGVVLAVVILAILIF